MSKAEDNYKAYFRSEAEITMRCMRTIKIFGEGITIDIEALRQRGVQVQIVDPAGTFDYKGPDKHINMYDQSCRKADKLLKITGTVFFTTYAGSVMSSEPLKIELNHEDIWEEAKGEVAEETKREKIDDIKQKLRTRKSFWDRISLWGKGK